MGAAVRSVSERFTGGRPSCHHAHRAHHPEGPQHRLGDVDLERTGKMPSVGFRQDTSDYVAGERR